MATTVTLKPNAIDISGSTSGTTTLQATAVAGTTTLTLPAATDTLVGKATTDTLTNKTLTGAVMNGTVGATTPSTGAFTSITASTTLTVTGAGSIQGLTVGRGGSAVASNTAVGSDALLSTSGGQNVAIGYQALTANTSGGTSVAVGYQALDANTTGDSLVAVGWGALGANSTGSSSVAVGRGALQSATTASFNTAIGRDALFSNTAAENTAVGAQAGQSNTGSTGLVFVGFSAGQLNTGALNTGVGFNALQNNTTGQGCTALGYRAAYNSTGSQNTALGYSSGSAITTGANNVILGSYTGSAAPISATGSNYIVLSDGDGNVRGYFTNTGLWTVNATSNPGYRTYQESDQSAYYNIGLKNTSAANGGNYIQFLNSAAATAGYIAQTGATTVSYTTSSDYRLKENIAPMTGALAKVVALNPVTYKWKIDGTDGEGFIAHELAEICSYAVVGEKDAVDADGKPVYQGIDTSFLVATLTAAIQELKAEFDAYKATHP